MEVTLLDSDITTEVLKKRNLTVKTKAAKYLREYGNFTISAFTRFEIRRGLLERQAVRQLGRFEEFCKHSLILPLDDAVLEQACLLWVIAYRGGYPRGDADLLIASTALVHRLALATGNTEHFDWVPNLTLVDWRVA